MSDSQIPMRASAAASGASRGFALPADGLVRDAADLGMRSKIVRAVQWAFSFPVMLATFLVAGVFVSARDFQVDPDLWWHVKVGESILATHRFPTTDPYSFTVHGQPWLAYEWLGEVVLAAAQRFAGIQGLEILLIALGSAVMLAIYAFATIRAKNSKAGFAATAILLSLAAASFSLRPQMFGYLFLVLTLILLNLFREGKRNALWWLPLLMVLWVNTHGSWIIGMSVIFVYWMSGLFEFQVGGIEARRWSADEKKRISFAFLLCVCALPITPYGTRIAMSPIEFASSLPLNIAYILEWQPMQFNLFGGKIFLLLLFGFIVAQAAMKLTWRVEEFGLYLFGTMLAFLHIRFLLLFVPFAAPIFAVILARWIKGYEARKDRLLLNALLIAGVAIAVVHYFPSRNALDKIVAQRWPVAAVEFLSSHELPGPMYNAYFYGGYLVWSRGPEHKVFIDGRGDVYERGGVFADYLHISRIQPGALGVLRNYGIQSCLIERDEPLGTVLSASPDWKRIYQDGVAAIYVRQPRF
jgi:hypothetical protein